MHRLLLGLVIISLLLPSSVLAGRKPRAAEAGNSITAIPVDGTFNWGDEVTFSYTSTYEYPVVSAYCSQNGNVVWGASGPIWREPQVFILASLAWTGGAADCVAELRVLDNNSGNVKTVADTTFHVDP